MSHALLGVLSAPPPPEFFFNGVLWTGNATYARDITIPQVDIQNGLSIAQSRSVAGRTWKWNFHDSGTLRYFNTASNSGLIIPNGWSVPSENTLRILTSTSTLNNSGESYFALGLRKTPGFMDIVFRNGTGVQAQVAHSLGSIPKAILCTYAGASTAFTAAAFSPSWANILTLQASGNAFANAQWPVAPTATHFTVGTIAPANSGSGSPRIAYVLFGGPNVETLTYVGNGNAVGPRINLPFRPRLLWIKKTGTGGTGRPWVLLDVFRGFGARLSTMETTVESAVTYVTVDDTGFDITSSAAEINESGFTFFCLAIR